MTPTQPAGAALADECAALLTTLAKADDEAWRRPALGRWDLAELIAHVSLGLRELAGAEPCPGPAALDRVERARIVADPEATADAAIAEASVIGDEERLPQLTRAVDAALETLGRHDAHTTLTGRHGPMRADDHAACATLELVVHHMDVAACLEVPPATAPAAGRTAAEILEALLDGPRPRAMGRARLLKAATGRIEVDDPRFPLLT